MHFSGNSIFQRAGRSTASTNEPIHINLYANKGKFDFRGHHEAIFVKNWFRNIVFIRWSKKKKNGTKIGLFSSNEYHFVVQGFFRRRKKIRPPKLSLV